MFKLRIVHTTGREVLFRVRSTRRRSEVTRIAAVQSGLPVKMIKRRSRGNLFTVRPTMIFIKLGYATGRLAAFALVLL